MQLSLTRDGTEENGLEAKTDRGSPFWISHDHGIDCGLESVSNTAAIPKIAATIVMLCLNNTIVIQGGGLNLFTQLWRDILLAVNGGASHARLRWVGNLRLRPDVPMGVPRPRYSYPVKDSEVPDYFVSVPLSTGLLV